MPSCLICILSEETQEAKIKHIRKYREVHARKTSRQDNLRERFNMLLLTSDSVILHNSSFLHKNKESLPLEVRELVQEPVTALKTDSEIVNVEQRKAEEEKEGEGKEEDVQEDSD